jgi:hypothetical protein
MTDERRYDPDEVDAIFETAASERAPARRALPAASDGGLTISELQAIAREVGLSPERVADAAVALDLNRGILPRRHVMGMPASVGRSVDLPRAPTDLEWERFVGEMRETFLAQGTLAGHGRIREWSNGNLHAVIEPTQTGTRLRMATTKSEAAAWATMGISVIIVAVIMAVAMLAKGKTGLEMIVPALFALFGVGGLGFNALSLQRWAGEREQPMAHLGARAREMLRAPIAEGPLLPPPAD